MQRFLCQRASLKPHSLECGRHVEHPNLTTHRRRDDIQKSLIFDESSANQTTPFKVWWCIDFLIEIIFSFCMVYFGENELVDFVTGSRDLDRSILQSYPDKISDEQRTVKREDHYDYFFCYSRLQKSTLLAFLKKVEGQFRGASYMILRNGKVIMSRSSNGRLDTLENTE